MSGLGMGPLDRRGPGRRAADGCFPGGLAQSREGKAVVDEALWHDALLSSDTETFLAAARNYLGPIKTPYDKRAIVERLSSFFRKPEVKEAILNLLDELDAHILGVILIVGPLSEAKLRQLFVGELPLFDLGIRIANLFDRFLIFRFEKAGQRLIGVNPLIAADLETVVLSAPLLFGHASAAKRSGADSGTLESAGSAHVAAVGHASNDPHLKMPAAEQEQEICDARAVVAFFVFLMHNPGALRKDGGLTKRASGRAALILPIKDPERGVNLLRALEAAGFIGSADDGRTPALAEFRAALRRWGDALPVFLALRLARVEHDAEAEGQRSQGAGVAAEAAADQAAENGRESALDAEVLGAALVAAPRGLVFSRGGLGRWLGMTSLRARRSLYRVPGAYASPHEDDFRYDPRGIISALEKLGIVRNLDSAAGETSIQDRLVISEESLRGWPEALSALKNGTGTEAAESAEAMDADAALKGPLSAGRQEDQRGPERPILVAEGSHALHLLPEAGLEDRLFVGSVARPTSFGEVWSCEVDRESAHLAFSFAINADDIIRRLETLCQRPLPQSLSFSLHAWEEEYRSLRLYRGYILVADERRRPVIENSRVLAPYIAERLGPGIYVLAVSGSEEAAELMEAAGLESPPETHYGRVHGGRQDSPEGHSEDTALNPQEPLLQGNRGRAIQEALEPFARLSKSIEAGTPLAGLRSGSSPSLDPSQRIVELKKSLEKIATGVESAAPSSQPHEMHRSPSDVKELSERIERRLILTPEQLGTAEARSERMEASGLDFNVKVHLIERALRTSGDRLEVLYRLQDGDPVRALLRPVSLEKTEKGPVLEAENLATGSPVSVPLSRVSSVRRMRASLFGEEA